LARPRITRRTAAVAGGIAATGILVAVATLGLGLRLGPSGTPTVTGPTPMFIDEAAVSGLAQTYDGDFEYSVGGGVAVFDCNGDGKPDLYLAGGSNPAALYRNDSPTGGALRFTRVPSPTTDLVGVTGAYPIDIDGDGIIDLVVLRNGENVLLRGLGGCRFERANERWAFHGGTDSTMAFSATWEGSATLPTLAFGNYFDSSRPLDQGYHCQDNELVRPAPGGTAYAPAIPLTPSYCALSMLFSDWDRSGRMDLRVSNDDHYYPAGEGEEQLWHIAPGEPPRQYTAADGWVSLQLEGMGIASYDLTGDGYPDVFLTTQGANRLQTLAGGPSQPTYRDIGLKRGVNATVPFTGGESLPSTAWHDEFEDVNNDGFIDLFISKGNVTSQPGYALKDPSNLLLGQPDGTFHEAADAAGILSYARGRGAALADFNMDGMLDLIKVNYGAPVELWRNVGSGNASAPGPMGHWLAVQVTEPGPNRDAIGAWLEVRVGSVTMRRELTIGGGHVSGQLGWIHFGLGPATDADVRVVWPDGTAGPWQNVRADQFEVLERGATGPRGWMPPLP
jgi:enediyne biosynthesis protein E4